MRLSFINEGATFNDDYKVYVSGYPDQPVLTIPRVGFIRLFYGGYGDHYWSVHMLRGEQSGAGTILYFAALYWCLTNTQFTDTNGKLASDTSLNLDALRARKRMETQYKDYLYILSHPEADSIKINDATGSDWRRQATADEATMWRLKKLPPFNFEFIHETRQS